MSAAADFEKPVPWWKEPTKDQWLAWCGGVAGPGSRRFRLHPAPADHGADLAGVRRSANRGNCRVHRHSVAAFGRVESLPAGSPIASVARGRWWLQSCWYSLAQFRFRRFTELCRFGVSLAPCWALAWGRNGRPARRWWRKPGRRGRAALRSGCSRVRGASASYCRTRHTECCSTSIGWRGLLWLGILPVLAAEFVRRYVKEPEIWTENRRRQRNEHREVRAPLFSIFKRGLIGTTVSACWCMASAFVAFDTISGLMAAHPRKDVDLLALLAAPPIATAVGLGTVLVSGGWGIVSDKFGRRAAMIVPALLGILVAPLYLFGADAFWVAAGFIVVSVCAGNGIQGQMLTYLAERFPTEVRATAIAVCFTQGGMWQVLTRVPVHYESGFAIPMMAGAIVGTASLALALALGPETKGKVLVPDLAIV